MKVAILGAGFTGLSAALNLVEKGHTVYILEKDTDVGGLAMGFERKGWKWTLEKAYHHWFTNDDSVLNLAKKIGHPVLIKRPQTNIFVKGRILPFDSPKALLTFPYLSILERLQTALGVGFLKLLKNSKSLEGRKAMPWIRKYMGGNSTRLIWEPILKGKFGDFIEQVSLTWFWARIYKRTPSLAYPEGGFKKFAENLAEAVKVKGGQIYLKSEVESVTQKGEGWQVKTPSQSFVVDKIISTLPSPIFAKIFLNLPQTYIERITSVPHLSAQNLVLILNKPFMGSSYWLSIADPTFPFLVLAEHTNFMDKSHYNNEHILYIGNYLPPNHPYLKMDSKELLKTFDPYLKKINPIYQESLIDSYQFNAPFAQPVVSVDYQKLIPQFKSPLKNLYVANMDMVYPWDRGTNYAVEMGKKIAEIVNQDDETP